MAKDTKQRIIEAALKIFSEKGYESTNIRELTASLGLAKSSVYRHFSSKEELFVCMIDTIEEYYREVFEATGKPDSAPKSLDELKDMTKRLVGFTVHDPKIVAARRLIMIEQFRIEKIRDSANNHFLYGLEARFERIFAEMAKNGLIKKCDSRLLALTYTTPISVLIQLCDRQPEKESEALARIDAFIDFFIESYGIRQ